MKLSLWVGIIFLVDQISKLIILRNFTAGESLRILPFFHITFVSNTGTAFGLFQGVNSLFIFISIGIIAALVFWRKVIMGHGRWAAAGFVLVLGGAFGNLLDRIVRGQVVDFLDFLVWPVFNIADMSICVGTALLALFCTTNKKTEEVK